MLEQIDLDLKMSKEEYREKMDRLEIRLGELHRQIHDLGIPAVIVFEGWDAAGRGTLINELILRLDPRGFKVFANNSCHEDAAGHPFLWRYWNTTPAAGRIMIYDRSWYESVLADRIDGSAKKSDLDAVYNEIVSFERQLADSGCVPIKFFLHITKKEQKKRLEELDSEPATKWRVGEVEWRRHHKYDDYLSIIEETLTRTDRDCSPWTPVSAMDRRSAAVQICTRVVQALEQQVQRTEQQRRTKDDAAASPEPVPSPAVSLLDKAVVPADWNSDGYEKELDRWGDRLHMLHYETFKKKIPVLVLFEGWDAAGKGGAIKRLTGHFDPRGCDVIPVAAPNDTERAHHYLWRFWQSIPAAGRVAVFDRTWYGRVLVERVEGFCREEEWRRAYREINEFEEQQADFGTVIVKFWLHIDKDEQLRRFRDRENTPEKRWKITAEDWRNREKWDSYKTAVEEMLVRTSTRKAPWTVVAANSKEYARLTVLKTVAEAMRKAL